MNCNRLSSAASLFCWTCLRVTYKVLEIIPSSMNLEPNNQQRRNAARSPGTMNSPENRGVHSSHHRSNLALAQHRRSKKLHVEITTSKEPGHNDFWTVSSRPSEARNHSSLASFGHVDSLLDTPGHAHSIRIFISTLFIHYKFWVFYVCKDPELHLPPLLKTTTQIKLVIHLKTG